MAKSRKQEDDREDSPETLPMSAADAADAGDNAGGPEESNEPRAEPLPRWKIRPKSGEVGESVVQAATVEDAIRAYNGASTQYAAKQLIIEAL